MLAIVVIVVPVPPSSSMYTSSVASSWLDRVAVDFGAHEVGDQTCAAVLALAADLGLDVGTHPVQADAGVGALRRHPVGDLLVRLPAVDRDAEQIEEQQARERAGEIRPSRRTCRAR